MPAASGRKRVNELSNYTADRTARNLPHVDLPLNILYGSRLRCPHEKCEMWEMTHVVDVVWEEDPHERDRHWVRMEVRCESGHGFLLLIRNHAGKSHVEGRMLDDVVSPFAEGAKW